MYFILSYLGLDEMTFNKICDKCVEKYEVKKEKLQFLRLKLVFVAKHKLQQ